MSRAGAAIVGTVPSPGTGSDSDLTGSDGDTAPELASPGPRRSEQRGRGEGGQWLRWRLRAATDSAAVPSLGRLTGCQLLYCNRRRRYCNFRYLSLFKKKNNVDGFTSRMVLRIYPRHR